MSLLGKLRQLLGDIKTIDGAIVLTYHRINDRLPKGGLVVAPSEFEKQMSFLNMYRNAFRVISVPELLRWLKGELKDDARRTKIVITFDDGYRDNYINAFPVLKQYRFPAIVFLTAGLINGVSKEYLSAEEVKEMAASGITFGAHTLTHPHLDKISPEDAKLEMEGSYKALKDITGSPEIAFCYPYGDYNEGVKSMVKDAGFSCAFTVKPGINYAGQDPFEIKRVDVLGGDVFSSFKYKITDKYEDTGVSLYRK